MDIHWIVTLIAILPFWFLQNCIHELSHGLTIYLGWKWDFSIWPFPSFRMDGRFSFAHTTFSRTEESKDLKESDWALVFAMPKFINILFISVFSVLAAAVSNDTITMLMLTFVWANFIDFTVGMLSAIRKINLVYGTPNDMIKLQRILKLPARVMRVLSISLVVAMTTPVIVTTLIQLL